MVIEVGWLFTRWSTFFAFFWLICKLAFRTSLFLMLIIIVILCKSKLLYVRIILFRGIFYIRGDRILTPDQKCRLPPISGSSKFLVPVQIESLKAKLCHASTQNRALSLKQSTNSPGFHFKKCWFPF